MKGFVDFVDISCPTVHNCEYRQVFVCRFTHFFRACRLQSGDDTDVERDLTRSNDDDEGPSPDGDNVAVKTHRFRVSRDRVDEDDGSEMTAVDLSSSYPGRDGEGEMVAPESLHGEAAMADIGCNSCFLRFPSLYPSPSLCVGSVLAVKPIHK